MIKVFDPELTRQDIRAVETALENDELSGRSPIVGRFEEAFAKYCGVKHAIAVNSGSSALFLALKALNLPRGCKVIVPSFGYIAIPNAVVQAGYDPLFVDVDITTGNISIEELNKTLEGPGTIRAIVLIHTYGLPCEMDMIKVLAEKHSLKIIEDAAEAHGAEYAGEKVGSIGDIGCFSFFANKIITTGEGGMITTNDDAIAADIRGMKDQYNGTKRYYHEQMGYSLCMGAMQAALGLSQLARIDEILENKRRVAAHYIKHLRGAEMLMPPETSNPVWWAFGIVVSRDLRDPLMEHLMEKGIETRPFFTAYHNNPPYISGGSIKPAAQYLETRGLYLPSSHTLTTKDLEYVCGIINDFQRAATRSGGKTT